MGFGVWGLGFGVWGVGFRVEGSGGLGFTVGLGSLGFRVWTRDSKANAETWTHFAITTDLVADGLTHRLLRTMAPCLHPLSAPEGIFLSTT